MAEGLAAARTRLAYLLQALFGVSPQLLAMEQGLATRRPFLSNLGLHLPPAGRAVRGLAEGRWYEAAALHAAAHLRYPGRFERGSLKPVQIALVGVLEDARVERLAIAEMPGLRALWLPYHVAEPAHGDSFVVLMLRLARCLLDPAHPDPHPWVRKGCGLFEAALAPGCLAPASLREIASRLGHDIGQMRLPFNSREYVVEPAYRDDNAHLWEAEAAEPVRRQWSADEVATPPDGGASAAEPRTVADAAPLARLQYREWDRLVRGYRSDWCTVLESRPVPGDPAALQSSLERHAGLLRQMERSWDAGRLSQRVRLRAQLQGDELDIDAAVASAIERRAGHAPREKIHQRLDRRRQDATVLVLLDASASTADPVPASGGSVLDLGLQAALLTAVVLSLGGDRCAVHAFASNGRHEVRYERALDFGEPLDALAMSRLAGVRSRFSTRMGAAVRHASAVLAAERGRRMLVVVTDGAPHDVDIFDSRYLVEDARWAVLEAARLGVEVFCVSLDAGADAYVRGIFGVRGYRVVDRVGALVGVLAGVVW